MHRDSVEAVPVCRKRLNIMSAPWHHARLASCTCRTGSQQHDAAKAAALHPATHQTRPLLNPTQPMPNETALASAANTCYSNHIQPGTTGQSHSVARTCTQSTYRCTAAHRLSAQAAATRPHSCRLLSRQPAPSRCCCVLIRQLPAVGWCGNEASVLPRLCVQQVAGQQLTRPRPPHRPRPHPPRYLPPHACACAWLHHPPPAAAAAWYSRKQTASALAGQLTRIWP